MSSQTDATLTVNPQPGVHSQAAQPSEQTPTPYLLVVEGHSSLLRPLPPSGDILIGRAEDCDLRLSDKTASRHHARLSIQPTGPSAGITLFDLGSHNGTRVMGQRVVGSRRLQHGDVIQFCEVHLVLHAPGLLHQNQDLLPVPAFQTRLAQEVERAHQYGRSLSLVCLQLEEQTDVPRLLLALSKHLRRIDVASRHERNLHILLPEVSRQDAGSISHPLVGAARLIEPRVRAGLAVFPSDGGDADSLLLSAQAAAGMAQVGKLLLADAAQQTLSIGPHEVLIADGAMQGIYGLLERLARSPIAVLIQGETGTGKEIAATALHVWSKRSGRFVAQNCAALPETLAESELFGHEKGAFTGAISAKAGLLEQAAQGTLLLDEVGELSLLVQAKLLRALETQKIVRLGGQREIAVDVRIVAATHRDLEADVAQGRFRQDLFFRLVAARVHLPPLRDRRREIPLLLRHFVRRAAQRLQLPPPEFSEAALALLLSYGFSGNVRELRNVCDYVVATTQTGIVTTADLGAALRASAIPATATNTPIATPPQSTALLGPKFRNLEDEIRALEQRRMLEALAETEGVQNKAAELLGMPVRTFAHKMKQYGLRPKTPS